ncbi:hypothetical protein ACA910_008091 [Epithemia clementina (nom. ined.)]
MVTAAILNKLTAACVDIPCCANLVKNNTNDHKEEAVKPSKATSTKTFHIKKKNKYSGQASKHEDFLWIQLPAAAKKAATALGYEKETWDNSTLIDIDHKPWHDLTEEQKTHAATLGWDHDSWEHKYEETSWANLPSLVQEAATELGFTEHTWDHSEWPESLDYSWHEMTDQQRLCLNVIGYTEQTWG